MQFATVLVFQKRVSIKKFERCPDRLDFKNQILFHFVKLWLEKEEAQEFPSAAWLMHSSRAELLAAVVGPLAGKGLLVVGAVKINFSFSDNVY